jgi:hypothetical protein
MGRELKRVPLDFGWPINVIWGGYLNPFSTQSTKCPDCDGTGSSPESKLLSDQWYGKAPFRPEDRGSVPLTPDTPAVRAFAERNVNHAGHFYGTGDDAIRREARRLADMWNTQWCHHLNELDVAALLKEERLHDLTHTWKQGEGWKPKIPKHVPTPEEVNTWALSGFGHDSINSWICVRAECKRLGFNQACGRCDGEAVLWPSKAIKRQCERWKAAEPPAGEGFQLWETVSEGSPISPVFDTPERLADWLVAHPWGNLDKGTTRGQWLAFIKGPGWAPSMISDGSGVHSGVQAVAAMEAK